MLLMRMTCYEKNYRKRSYQENVAVGSGAKEAIAKILITLNYIEIHSVTSA